MAKLISDDFVVNIEFSNYIDGDIDYRFQFTYRNGAIFNPLITEQDFFIVKEVEDDYLFEVLQDALDITIEEFLKSNCEELSVLWEPNPHMSLVITPCFNLGFKDLKFPEKMPSEEQERLKEIDDLRSMGRQYPGDTFILEFCIRSPNLKNFKYEPSKFWGNAVGATVMVRRFQLEQFCAELEKEYGVFRGKFRVDDLGREVEKFLAGETPIEEMTNLEKQFDREMRNIYEKAKELGMKGDAFIALIEEHSGRKAAKLLLRRNDSTSGAEKLRFLQIVKGEGIKFTAEYLVAQPQWEKLFTVGEVKKAKARLDQWK